MTDLLTTAQVNQIRDVFHDLSETFAFPITIRRTTYTQGAFRSAPALEDIALVAIREFVSLSDDDQFRNAMGPASAHEVKLYIHWRDMEDAGLIDAENKMLLDHNDLIVMEGEEYELISFDGIAEMSKKPAFAYLKVKRKWAQA